MTLTTIDYLTENNIEVSRSSVSVLVMIQEKRYNNNLMYTLPVFEHPIFWHYLILNTLKCENFVAHIYVLKLTRERVYPPSGL